MSSGNASPTLATLSRRLTSTSQLLLERSRVISLSMKPSASSTNTIVRNLTSIKRDLQQIEDDLESNGLRGKGKQGESEVEKQVREIGESYDRLVGMLGEDGAGRDKAKPLIRDVPQPAAEPVSSEAEAEDPFSDGPTPPRTSLEPPTPTVSQGQQGKNSNGNDPFLSRSASQSTTPFRDDPEDNPRISDSEMMSQQQVLMDDQDERLNHLSNSINRQNQLSVQIGDELDVHHQLLEDTDGAMDRTQARLGRAKKRLDKVADEAKQYGSTITIVALIFILLILIIVFKT